MNPFNDIASMFHKYFNSAATLRWWLLFWVNLVAVYILQYNDGFTYLFLGDATKLSFVILALYSVTTLWVGHRTWDINDICYYNDEKNTNIDVGWFISDAMLTLGMIGTVAGFIIMGDAFNTMDINDEVALQQSLAGMAGGIATALLTTLTGLTCSLLLKIQLMNFDRSVVTK